MIKQLIVLAILALSLFSFTFEKEENLAVFQSDKVSNVLEKLGVENPNRIDRDILGFSAKAGKEIFHNGFTINANGKEGKEQSKHFVCTSCHNTVREDPDLTVADPEARLNYAMDKNIPFLQGTTVHGIVNRTAFYNGDYYKKYGDLVYEARNDIRNAIQLCATECAQGRALDDWELESILAYMWELELEMSDLEMSEVEYNFVNKALNGDAEKEQAAEIIQSKFLAASPATFIPPPAERKKVNFDEADLEEGRNVFVKSCLHCHENQRYSYFMLDESKMTFGHLKRKAKGYGSHSIYQVIRYGVPTYLGKKSYMPHYPVEKMSEKQLNNLRAYIEYKAKYG